MDAEAAPEGDWRRWSAWRRSRPKGNDGEVGFERPSVQALLCRGLSGPVHGKEVGEATGNRSMRSTDDNSLWRVTAASAWRSS
jgi:hypothetical protein